MEDVVSRLCGSPPSDPLPVWVSGHVGVCFNQLILSTVPHVLFAISSACHAGAYRNSQFSSPSPAWHCRILFSFLLTLFCAAELALGAAFPREVPSSLEVLSGGVYCLSWFTHFLVLLSLRRTLYTSSRGPLSLVLPVLLLIPSSVIRIVWLFQQGAVTSPLNSVLASRFSLSCLRLCFVVLYFGASLVPSPSRRFPVNVSINEGDEDVSLLFPHSVSEETSEDNESLLSQLFYFWMKPLLQRGARGELKQPHDVPLLPYGLRTAGVCQKFLSKSPPGTLRLLSTLNASFGSRYYSLGLIKLCSTILGFMGPVLLNFLVNFMETREEPLSWGVIYTAGLFCSGFLGALLQNQFTHQVNKVMLAVRTSVLTTVYRKVIHGEGTGLAGFSPGEVMNLMSTDADRISNFCRSFHELWSLPLQFSITLYLLYQQVGIAFLGGLGLALLLVPLNKVVATRIMNNNKELLQHKDARVKLVTELLSGMRVVKFYTWEEHFARQLTILRKKELRSLRTIKLLDAVCVYLWAALPVLISIITFVTYVLLGNQLTAAKVFTALALVGMLILPLNSFPWVLNGILEAKVSLDRIQSFLELPDQNLLMYYNTQAPPTEGTSVVDMQNALFSWAAEFKDYMERSTSLQVFIGHLSVPKGALVAIVGKVGCGKSSLLSAMTGELTRHRGTLYMSHQEAGFGFVAQEPWIQFASIRENILFGKEYNERLYKKVVEACALAEDLSIFPAGDQTEVGENGVTLSGGQKARLSLARAVYQEKDIYLLDDPLAAVDADVASHLMEKCILGILQHRTRILCTHRTELLEKADLLVLMEDGKIIQTGPPEEILALFEASPKLKVSQSDAKEKGRSGSSVNEEDEGKEVLFTGSAMGEEEKKEGAVSLQVYAAYWRAVGSCLAISVLLALFFMQASRNVSDWWLSHWIASLSDKSGNESISVLSPPVLSPALLLFSPGALVSPVRWTESSSQNSSGDITFYLSVYGGIAAANSIFTALRALLFALGTVHAATVIHRRLLQRVLLATVTFFDSTPVGRIINRFSSDMYCVDDFLPFILNIFLANIFGLLGMLVMISYGLPWILPVLLPLGLLYYSIQRFYRHTSRELKRLQSITLSPIYSHFSETLSGLSTIRAMRHADRFKVECESRVEMNQRCVYASNTAVQWLDIRLQMIGVVVVTAIAVIAIIQHQRKAGDPGLVGLSLSYALSITGLLSGLISSFTQSEAMMVSVERAEEYSTTLPCEPREGTVMVGPEWPRNGCIEFRDAILCYRPGLPNALDGVNFSISPGEKIGIVGRTGSGKSSLFLALFRMIELNSGHILIDDTSTQELALEDLRSRLAIIPQDAFLFSGSVRENLDPLSHHADSNLMDVLSQCHLQDLVERMGGLDAEVGDRGKNFSLGQRQLLCLARALLTQAKVLCIDEATASVDHQTDQLLQQTIRERFRDRTVLTIAHRLNTIMDSDRVLVMHAGRVAEMGSPIVLSSKRDSQFYRLINHGQSGCTED
ncbi:PREDICTED: multidrug resistance-associated protein 7 [Nanorana parkeri]|uniref:multidrug resistance-associated protein 7 n=1 Tax=Nanorana parkeri TaxID=125878 RepID=UPI0008540B5B|nr:PREDICTED: multidrug resistance-associated protein 7 [Nanorana parkeri]